MVFFTQRARPALCASEELAQNGARRETVPLPLSTLCDGILG
jgi:hypothetical protein